MKGSLVALAILATFPAVGQQNWKPGEAAPKFTIMALDGTRRTIGQLKEEGPFFLYFIHDGDPVNSLAKRFVDRIAGAYMPARTKWYGVVDMKANRARSFNSEGVTPYKFLLDPDSSVRKLFKVESSPTVILVGSDGRIVKAWPGFSAYWLKDINAEAARVNRQPMKRLDFSKAPSVTIFGSGY